MKLLRSPGIDRRDFLRGTTCALGLLALPPLTRFLPAVGEPLDFVQAGRDLLARNGLDPDQLSPDSYFELLSRACVGIAIGPVVLHIPKEGFKANDARAKSYPSAKETLELAIPAVLKALIQMEEWTLAGKARGLRDADVRRLLKALEVSEDFEFDAAEQPLGLSDLLGEKIGKKEQAILDEIDAMLSAGMNAEDADSEVMPPVPIVVLPTRREMVEFACMAGVVEPALTEVFHQAAITGWIHSYYGSADHLGRAQLLCLEEGQVGDGALEQWTVASEPTDTGLAQQTITYDAIIALVGARCSNAPNWFAIGLGLAGTASQYDSIAGRLGADTVGDMTPPRQAFVPGGASKGGFFLRNLSDLRGKRSTKDFLRLLEHRKQAGYERLEERDRDDPQRKAARANDATVFFNLRDTTGSEESGHLHFGPYVGQDVTHLTGKNLGSDVALVQRAVFTLVASKLTEWDDGEGLARLLSSPDDTTGVFEERFESEVGTTPSELERAVFEKIKKK